MIFSGNFLEVFPFVVASIIPALSFHEWGHAAMAHAFGDDTAKRQGRLTLNPLAHLDVMGAIFIVLVGFGWAKPVPVDPRNYKSKSAFFWVPFAGPLMNIVLAVVFAILLRFEAPQLFGSTYGPILATICHWSVMINLFLFFFNFIPLGPLDGRQIVESLLPHEKAFRFGRWNDQYGSMVFFGIILLEFIAPIGVLDFVVVLPSRVIAAFLLA